MPVVMRFVLAALVLGALAAPAGASAQPTLRYAAPAASIARGAPLTFAVQTTAAPGAVTVRVAGALETGADGLLTGADGTWLDAQAAPLASGLIGWTVPRSSVLRQRPGTYYWQAFVPGEPPQLVGPVQKLQVTLPPGDRGRGRLFPRFGRRGSARFLESMANLPATVSRTRFRTLARATAARWGLRAAGWTRLTAGARDGYDVAGFSPDVPAGVLGLETDFTRGGRVIEQDLALNPDEDWAAGPAYPRLTQIDLESVLLHELGHMAGNKRHRAVCTNSPMVVALGAGEWWRGPRDHWFGQCTGAVAAAATAASAPGLLAHRVVPVD
jgi:hypothetical protein